VAGTPALVAAIFQAAKASDRVLTDDEILGICREHAPAKPVAVS